MVGALSRGPALGYVEADHRAEEGDARVYPRIIAPALEGEGPRSRDAAYGARSMPLEQENVDAWRLS